MVCLHALSKLRNTSGRHVTNHAARNRIMNMILYHASDYINCSNDRVFIQALRSDGWLISFFESDDLLFNLFERYSTLKAFRN